MKKQKGAALIVVMSLLAISLMIGLMSMQTSQVDERLAGNYRAAADVQMAAERAAAQGWSERANHGRDLVDMDELRGMNWVTFINDNYLYEGDEFFSEDAVEADCPDGVECYFRIFESCENGNHCIVAMAAILDGSGIVLAESEQVFVEYGEGGGGGGGGGVVDDIMSQLLSDKLINVLRDFSFNSSNNDAARAWESYVGVNETIFSDGEGGLDRGEIAEFFDELRSIEGRGGPVTFLDSGSASSDSVSAASGGVLVIEGSGEFRIPNNSVFSGIMVVTNPGIRVSGGGGTRLEGGILHMPTSCEEARGCRPSLDVRGGNGVYSRDAIDFVLGELGGGPGILTWR